MFKTFGNSKEVFVNQDEGMFVAFPITLDTTAYTFETETRNGRTYVKAGSVVKEGDSVKQGQEIAEVGATGNVTGPHLHFEIRYQDRYIDPQSILEL